MQHATAEERREFQRLHLQTPLPGNFQSTPIRVIEVGVLGARISHDAPLDAQCGVLQFAHGTTTIALRSEIVRTLRAGPHYESGVRFLAAVGESGDHLREMLAAIVMRALEERQEATLQRLPFRTIDGDVTVRARDAQFLSYRLENGNWQRRPVFLPEQPSVGFTVAHGEDHDELRRLCEVYEASDAEGRRLIRLFAELSVSEVLQIPPTT